MGATNVMERPKVVITGMGAVTPLGIGAQNFWDQLIRGKSGVGPMTLCDPSPFPCQIAGEATEFDPLNYIDLK